MASISIARWIPAGALVMLMRGLASGLFCAVPAAAQQQQLRTEWNTNVTEYRGQNGRPVTVICPSGGSAGDVWGTDSYTDDSSVCSAAAHAGVISLVKGGVVTIVIGPGGDSYTESTRNGVTSRSFGKAPGSFTINPALEGRVDWRTSAKGIGLASGSLTVVCPPGGKNTGVWGTDQYTDDSSICGAAVHAGKITLAQGGRVTIHDAGAQASYPGSERNGVRSQEFANWPNSFQVSAPLTTKPVRSTAVIRAPVATGAGTGTIAPAQSAAATAPTRTGRAAPVSRAATSMTLSVTSTSVEQGATEEISAVTDTREVGGISWQSSNPALASVNAEGIVTGVEVGGPVTITATSGAASATATITVTALPPDPVGGANYPSAVVLGTLIPGSTRTIRGYFGSTNDRDRWYRVNVVTPQPSGCTAGASTGPIFVVKLTGIPAGRQYDLLLKKDHEAVLQEARASGNQDRSVSVIGTCGVPSASYYVQVQRTAGLPSSTTFTLTLAQGT
jgi:hypothetical protein